MHKTTLMIGGALSASIGAISMYVALKPALRKHLMQSHSASEAFSLLFGELERDALGIGEQAMALGHGASRQFSQAAHKQLTVAKKRSHHKKQPSHMQHHAAAKTAASKQ